MTDAICYRDAYADRIEAAVVASTEGADGQGALVVLDRTVFYPGGGGQPADRGLLLRAADGRAWTVARPARSMATSSMSSSQARMACRRPPATDVLTVDLDWARRYALMRTHTALHALCGVVWRDYGAQVTGGNMEPGSGRMDFEFERMSGDLVGEIEATVNDELAPRAGTSGSTSCRATRPSRFRTSSGPRSTCCRPASPRSGRSRSSGSTSRPMAARTSPTPARSASIRVTGYESKGRINKRIRIELVAPA